ncbi:MAG: ThuA domain-containing protein [Bythopirellula sp.]
MSARMTWIALSLVSLSWATAQTRVSLATEADTEAATEAQLTDGQFVLHLREQVATQAGKHVTKPAVRLEKWHPKDTAIIVCDMWDVHHCYNAVQRVNDMSGRMNALLHAARRAGAFIIHAPSSCLAPYTNHPARVRAQQAPVADNLPNDIGEWCHHVPSEQEATYPIDQTDGGVDDDPEVHRKWHEELAAAGKNPDAPWTRQTDALQIHDSDAITDDGAEVWNLLEARGIDNVILVGVHTNMCVLGRPFGLRQLAKNGRNVVLTRDLTDTMYNPAMHPFVNHHTGTDLIIEHIEKYVCPTILSSDLIGGTPHRFFDDKRPTLAVVVSEFEYETYKTLPEFAHQQLGKDFRVVYAINDDRDNHDLQGLQALEKADLMILSMWRRALPPEKLQLVRDFVAAGKPIVALRTSSHAFATREGTTPAGRATWQRFDRDVLRGNYDGHFGNHADQGDPPTKVWIHPDAKNSPIAAGIPTGEFKVASWLYKMGPLLEPAVPLLMGSVGDQPQHPVAWTVSLDNGQRIFYTSLGSQDDFEQPAFQHLLTNAVYWAAGIKAPTEIVAVD